MMVAQHPFMGGYDCVQQGSYQGKLFGVKRTMKNVQQLPTDNFQVYRGVSAMQGHEWQPTTRCGTQMGSLSCEPKGYSTNSTSEGLAHDGYRESTSLERVNYPKMKKEVSAFGPKHAEHARRLYRTEGLQSQVQLDLAPPCLQNYCPMQVSYTKQTLTNKESILLGDPVFERTINRKTYTDQVSRQVAVPVTLQQEAILKVAKISPRPNEKELKNPKIYSGLNERIGSYKMDQGAVKKSVDARNIEEEMDLSKAPVFQILCEISKN